MRVVWTITCAAFLALVLGLVLLCFIGPGAVALREVFTTGLWSEAALNPRRLRLLGRGLLIAIGAAVVAQVLGAGLAAGLTDRRRGWGLSFSTWISLLVLLTPPYIYAYAWSLVLLPGGSFIGAEGAVRWPAWLVHEGRAAWCLGTWTAPVAAVVLAGGWRTSGRPAYTLALPDATPIRAFIHGALPALGPWIFIALFVTGLLTVTEHSVCDLCQAPTWNTEIFALLQTWDSPGPLLAWPLMLLVGLFLLALYPFRQSLRGLLADIAGLQTMDEVQPADGRHRSVKRLAAVSVTAIVLLLPWLILLGALQDVDALRRTWYSFPLEWPHGLSYASTSALISISLAIGIDYMLVGKQRLWRALAYFVLTLAALAAAAPPALVGDSFAAAYVHWPAIGNHWLIVSLVTAARFAIIPILALQIGGRLAEAELRRMAAADGAGPSAAYLRVRLPLCRPILCSAGLIVGLLSLTEVPASHMVCPAGIESVALRLFNHIHYGRNDEIIAMSLYLMAFVAIVVLGVRIFSRTRPRWGI